MLHSSSESINLKRRNDNGKTALELLFHHAKDISAHLGDSWVPAKVLLPLQEAIGNWSRILFITDPEEAKPLSVGN